MNRVINLKISQQNLRKVENAKDVRVVKKLDRI